MGNKLKFYFDFDVINASVSDKKDRFEINLKTCNKTLSFYPINGEKTSEWCDAINEAIKHSDGKRYDNE